MSDRELITLSERQFNTFEQRLNAIRAELQIITERLGPVDKDANIHNVLQAGFTDIGKWLAVIADKLATPQPPTPTTARGTIMAKFKVSATNPDITIQLTGTGFTDAEGSSTGAADIDLSVESSNADAVEASITEQTLSDDKESVSANVSVHFGAPASDIAVLTYRATNRDTGAIVAAGTDEFTVEVGEASLGSVTSTVPLTPEG